jgi:hypothetical protein
MGRFHVNYLEQGKVGRCRLTAVSDAFAASLEPFRKKYKTYEKFCAPVTS